MLPPLKDLIDLYLCAKSLQPGPTVCDPMYCGPPGFSIHGIFQAKILEWVGGLPGPVMEHTSSKEY